MATIEVNNHDVVNVVALLEDIQNELLRSESARNRTGFAECDARTIKEGLDNVKDRIDKLTKVYLPTTNADQKYNVNAGESPIVVGPEV